METEEYRKCRKCLLLKSGKEDILDDINNRIAVIPPDEKTGKEKYRERLGCCSGCEFLVSGTCLKCGCYPEFRAAFKKNGCPLKKW